MSLASKAIVDWYHKWFVHRYPRPEAFGGLVDNHLQGRANYPLHADLLNSPVLPLIVSYNQHLKVTVPALRERREDIRFGCDFSWVENLAPF